jgi:LPPG:FO 2-phospho-L-lactate transferase
VTGGASHVAVLAGGVGAARLLTGMVRAMPPEAVTAVVNVGDDIELHGLHISPDLDTVVYTVAEAIDPERGWGLRDETWTAMDSLERYGGATWFRLGDQDLATHLFRTQRMADGAPLSTVTAEIASAWKLGLRVLPVTDDRLRTRVTIAPEPHSTAKSANGSRPGGFDAPEEVSFQEYFVGHQHSVPVSAVRFEGDVDARPAPGVLEAIMTASVVVIAPSNPIVSIGPVLAVPGVRNAVRQRRDSVVAVSPIVGGKALKGPADRMLRELGHEPSVVGVARLYAPLAGTLVIDEADRALAGDVEATGMGCVVTDTIMRDAEAAQALAHHVLHV